MIRSNKMKELLAKGECVFGAVVVEPIQAELLSNIGFDYMQIDGEHYPLTPASLEQIVRAADSGGAVSIARLPSNDPRQIMPFLETGILGLQVSHVMNEEDAQLLVDATKYAPLGHRGKGGGRAGLYGLVPPSQHIREWNENFMAIPQVEDKEAVDRLDEILAVEGVDAIAIGLGDLSVSLGYPDDKDHPEVFKVVEKMAKQIRDAGKSCSVSYPGNVKKYADAGVQIFKFGAIPMLRKFAMHELENGLRDTGRTL